MSLGIIGSAIAGAAQGAGEAGVYLGKTWINQDFEREKMAAEEQRQANIETLRNKFAAERQQAGFANERAMKTEVDQPFQEKTQKAGFEHSETLQRTNLAHNEILAERRQAFDADQHERNRGLTREQIASHEKIAQMNRASAEGIAKMGGTVQQDKDGNMLWFDRSGKARQIMDPSNPDSPLQGHKDLTPAAKAYADVIKVQLQGLDREELNPMLDVAGRAALTQRRAALNGDLLNVLTGGISEAGKKPKGGAAPGASDVGYLKSNPTPAMRAAFDSRFGAGAADRAMGSSGAQNTGGIINSAAGLPELREPPMGLQARKTAQIEADRMRAEEAAAAAQEDADRRRTEYSPGM